MQTLPRTTTTVNSVNWAVAPAMTPAELGAHDAHCGLTCDPDAHFGRGNDYDQCHIKYMRGDYTLGYIKAKGL